MPVGFPTGVFNFTLNSRYIEGVVYWELLKVIVNNE